jgi:hypothetical protein
VVDKSLRIITTDRSHAAKTCLNVDIMLGLHRVGKSNCVFVPIFVPVVLCMLCVPT